MSSIFLQNSVIYIAARIIRTFRDFLNEDLCMCLGSFKDLACQQAVMGDTPEHGLINYRDTKAKCRHLKILTCKGTLRQVFIRVYRLEIQSVMLVFSTCCPSSLLSGSLSPPPLAV